MTNTDIATARLMNQQVVTTSFKTAKDIVAWMGAMQAQDYNMCKWAIGIRLPGATQKTIEKAFDEGDIIRTHILRPTWHLVAAADIHWMIALCAPKIIASLKTRHKELELTGAIFKKSNSVIEKVLSKHKYLTRDGLISEFNKAKIRVDENRAPHLLFRAELDGLICSGPHVNGETTYTLLHEWVPEKKELARDEAMAKLAKTYFNSHGPATLQDFTTWSKTTLTEARKAIEIIKGDLITEKNGSQTWYMPKTLTKLPSMKDTAFLLPAFDEFIIGYKDRSNILTNEEHKRAVSNNGIFWPVMVVNGKIAGLWKRTVKKETVLIETKFFNRPDKKTKQLVEKASGSYGRFLDKKTEVEHGHI